MTSNKKIRTFQSFRFFAFLMIFLYHTKSLHHFSFYSAACAVSFFIILSGFLYGQKLYKSDIKLSLKNVKVFLISKIRKLFPLHIVMLFFSIPLTGIFAVKSISQILSWLKRFVVNFLLLQDYVPKQNVYFSFNGVSWFLSLLVFLLILTLPIMWLIKNITKKHEKRNIIIMMITVFLLGLLYLSFVYKNKLSYEYYLYIFPPSRLFEYTLGILGGCLFSLNSGNKKENKILSNILELLIIVLVMVPIYYEKFIPRLFYWSFAWIIPNILLLYIFGYKKGFISRLLSNKYLVKLGNISMELFLTHQLIIRYITRVSGKIIFPYFNYLLLLFIFIACVSIALFINHNFPKKQTS